MAQQRYNGNGWTRYQKLVMFRLDDIGKRASILEKKVDNLHTSIVLLKFKMGLIGGGAGAVVGFLIHLFI